METAWAVGFNALSLTEEEENILPSGSNEHIYVEVHRCGCFWIYEFTKQVSVM
jgi:hypothetical protein